MPALMNRDSVTIVLKRENPAMALKAGQGFIQRLVR
jgi:hypothetical protein